MIAMAVCLVIGIPLTLKKPKNKVFYTKDGCVAVALSWVALCVFGALPFVVSGYIPHPVDALFETVSGFTTTGSSILTDVEVLPHCVLIWRSFTHWIGGMGVLVFCFPCSCSPVDITHESYESRKPRDLLSANWFQRYSPLPKFFLYYLFWYDTCSDSPAVDWKVPLLILCVSPLVLPEPVDLVLSMTVLEATALYCQVVTTIFMILFGVNFSVYYLILTKKFRQAFKYEEVRYYFGIIIASILIITFNTVHLFRNVLVAFQQVAFQVASIITTTGFSSTDFNQWPALSKTVLVLLMFVGACAGSTGGGIKVSRILILCKAAKKEFQLYLHPNAVKKIKMDSKIISHDILRSTNIYISVYLLIFAASVLLIAIDNFDLITNFTAVAATLNNIGPGFEIAGPMGNFSSFSYLSKSVLIFDMLAGRLEIFPLLLLFFKDTWKRF